MAALIEARENDRDKHERDRLGIERDRWSDRQKTMELKFVSAADVEDMRRELRGLIQERATFNSKAMKPIIEGLERLEQKNDQKFGT